MTRWETYQSAGMLPSTGQDYWLEYPWGEIGALESMQDLGEDACTDYRHSGKWLLYSPWSNWMQNGRQLASILKQVISFTCITCESAPGEKIQMLLQGSVAWSFLLTAATR